MKQLATLDLRDLDRMGGGGTATVHRSGTGSERGLGPTSPTVAIVGLGYVGLPMALSFHAAGCSVIGIDVDPARRAAIEAGAVDLWGADLHRLEEARSSQTFVVDDDARILAAADAVFICVPTPIDRHQTPDTRALARACDAVVANARAGQVIALTSTTYVGCTREMLVEPLAGRGLEAGRDLFVAFCPERISPGDACDLKSVTRVVGGATPACGLVAAAVVGLAADSVHPVSSLEAAELTKLVENTFRAVNIALANEFADAAGVVGVDAIEVLDAAASKPYGFMSFTPGPGVGGHCIPCDPHYLLWGLRAERASAPLIERAMGALAARPTRVVERAVTVLGERGIAVDGARVLIAGVAYKPKVADIRESPALAIAALLRRRGAVVSAHDPLLQGVVLDDHGMGLPLLSEVDPAQFDLAIVHTLHPGHDSGWLADLPAVLDATYRLAPAVNVSRL